MDRIDRSVQRNALLTCLADYRALFGKMFLLTKRHVGQTIVELVLSCVFLGLLLALRYVFDRNYNSAYQLPRSRPHDTMLFDGLATNTIYYYPANPCATTIMTNVINGLSSRWSAFPTNLQTLSNPNIALLSNTTQQSIYAFIYFTNLDSCSSPSTMPDQISYTLRMPEYGDSQYSYHAQAAKIVENDYLWKRSPQDFCQDNSSTVNYTGQFVGVQYFVDLSIIQYATNITQNPSSIYLNHFGCPEYYYDEFHSTYSFFIPILISLIFITPFILNVGYVVEERRNKTKEYLRIFGLRTWINNLVWVTRTMCIYFLLTSLVTGLSMITFPSSNAMPTSVSKAIFNYIHWTLIWTILFVYSIELSCFSVFFGQIFSSPLLAKFLSFVIWVLTFIDFYPGAPIAVRYILCLFPNTGLMFSLLVVQQYERRSGSIATYQQLYSNLFTYPLYIGLCLLLMLIYSVIYMLLAIYIDRINPGEFGVARPFYFIFNRCCCCCPKRQTPSTVVPRESVPGRSEDDWIELNPMGTQAQPVMRTIRLTKTFGKFKAVSELSIDFYPGEVCSLLGHNGAGKTTATFILVGMLEPTSGQVFVDGLDYRTHSEQIRQRIGFCPQADILYDLLSVEEHLQLMAQMRHMNRESMNATMMTILDLIGLTDDRHKLSKDLSGGMKRRLSIGIALVGDPKVLIFDEPTSGIDPPNRRLIWTLIQKLKDAGKCVILTTHFLEEADILSDRIAIMTHGQLQASGTPSFLKRHSEFKYRLFVEKQELCNTEHVTRFLQQHIQDVALERESSSELVFGIKRDASRQLTRLITALDQQSSALAINSYGLSMTTIEEVFLKLVQEQDDDTRRVLAEKVFSQRCHRNTGVRLFRIQLWALIVKRWLLLRRQVAFLVGFFLLPILLEILAVAIIPSPKEIEASILQNRRYPNAQMQLIPSIYNPHTVIIDPSNTQSRLRTYLLGTNANIEEVASNLIIDQVQSQWNSSEDTFITKYQMGFSLSSNNLTTDAYYSTVNFHAMATSLGVAATNLFQFYGNSSSKMILTTNQPLLISTGTLGGQTLFFQMIFCFDTIPVSLFNFINGIIVSIFIALLVLNLVRERTSRSKDLQLLSGLSKFTYWFSHAMCDFILCLMVISLLTVIVKIGAMARPDENAEVRIYHSTENTGYFFLMCMMYCLASIPFIYTYSLIPMAGSVGLILFVIVNVLVCFLDMVLGFIVVFFQEQSSSISTVMTNIRLVMSILFPTVTFKHALFSIHLRSSETCVSAVNSVMGTSYTSTEPWMSMKQPGLGVPFVIFLGLMIFYWLVIIAIEQSTYQCPRKPSRIVATEWSDALLDEDVRNERRIILNKESQVTSAAVIVEDLVQTYKKRKEKSRLCDEQNAVDHLNFYVPQGSCFGLLGTNGAGKTTTFRVLIKDIQPTSGRVNIHTQTNSQIGFCPQFDWLVDNLTVSETLMLFARLKGVPSNDMIHLCAQMIELFGLKNYEKREVEKLSGGNKRKVSAALAFLANPALIFLDEPTTGLDAAAKRKLWNVIRVARDVGLTIIMTSHSMEECEALCTKIGIMKSGQFVCLGNLQHLKNRFSHGYSVQVKVPVSAIDSFKEELFHNLPGVEIEEQHNGMLFCNVPIHSTVDRQQSGFYDLSRVVEFFNGKQDRNEIESYTLSQTTLEQIFVRLVGQSPELI